MANTQLPEKPVTDFADKVAVEVIGDWLPNIGDTRTVSDMVAEGVRRGYAMGTGVAA